MKKSALFLAFSLLTAAPALAQTAFWSFDENNNQAMIPPQCDGQFDETRGGVFLPTPQEMYEQGELFLLEKGVNRNNAGYCFLAAALQDHVDAQFRVAQLYNKGIVLPQNDLAAYRWAFIAALNGHEEAEQMTLMLEQFLTAEDIQLATVPVEQMLPKINNNTSADLQKQEEILTEKKAKLEAINNEIDLILGITPISVGTNKPKPNETPTESDLVDMSMTGVDGDIFGEDDRM